MATRLPITLYPDPLLRRTSRDVSLDELPALQDFIDDMIVTMKEADGIGLAAPQVNRSIRIIVIVHKDGPLVCINPLLKKLSFRKESQEEGCLSIPKVYGLVKRSKRLEFTALDRHGKMFSGTADGLFARVLLHEVDHLDGVLFIDRAQKITQGTLPKNP